MPRAKVSGDLIKMLTGGFRNEMKWTRLEKCELLHRCMQIRLACGADTRSDTLHARCYRECQVDNMSKVFWKLPITGIIPAHGSILPGLLRNFVLLTSIT